MSQPITPDAPSATPAASPPRRRIPLSLILLALVCAAFWGDVLLGGRVLLPGAMLRGFAPFGNDAQSPWTILRWDALAQYFPWRAFASSELRAGHIPLWNPHQFAGAPFVANGQSAVFYIGSLPFWVLDTARAFGIAAFAHSLLAAGGAFLLLRRWRLSSGASICGAVAWTMSGYLASWNALPTLAHTASWLPLLLLLFERAVDADSEKPQVLGAPFARVAWFAIALCCALLAGHAQIFAFLVLALLWRAVTLQAPLRALQVLAAGGIWAALLGALQLLPTLELARLGHRAGAVASDLGWREIALRALQPGELFALVAPGWPMAWQSLNENFPYMGAAGVLLALLGAALGVRKFRSPQAFALGLVVLGLGTALAWPPARWAYFGLPGASQFAGVGRALVLWSLGASLLAAFGVEALGRKFPARASAISLAACALVVLELGFNGWSERQTASRAEIYPQTKLTTWLQQNVQKGERVAFITPREGWLPREGFREGRSHPPGVLPPNGAMVYGLDDVGGYDSLAPAAYRKYLNEGEGRDVAPPLNGNIVSPGAANAHFGALNVRYIITLSSESMPPNASRALETEGCTVWKLPANNANVQQSGVDFSPGFRDGKYQPQSFKLGVFLSMCALAVVAVALAPRFSKRSSVHLASQRESS
jgi:hypothetical protein